MTGPANGSTAKPLRILTVTNRWPRPTHHGGIFVKRLVEAIRALGHEVDVELVAQSRGRHDYVTAANRVRAQATGGGYDVVHVHYGLSALAARLVTTTPRVLTLYGSDINTPWQRMVSLWFSRRYAARIYVSRRLAQVARDPEGIVIPPGVELDDFVPADRSAAREALGASPDDRLVLFGGNPARGVKGWELFSEVIDRLQTAGIPAKPLVLSSAGQTQDQLVRKFDAADCLLFTSKQGSEGSPIVVKEAMAMGLPVVSVDVGDVAEQLEGIEPSAVVRFQSDDGHDRSRSDLVAALSNAVSRVLAARRRSTGRERVLELASDRVAKRVLAVYEAVAR